MPPNTSLRSGKGAHPRCERGRRRCWGRRPGPGVGRPSSLLAESWEEDASSDFVGLAARGVGGAAGSVSACAGGKLMSAPFPQP